MATAYYEGSQQIYINLHRWPAENVVRQITEDYWAKVVELSKEGAKKYGSDQV